MLIQERNKNKIDNSLNNLQCIQFGEKEIECPTQSEDIKQWNFIESVYRKPFVNVKIENLVSSIDSKTSIEILANQEDNRPSPLSTIADEICIAMNIAINDK